MKKLFAVLLFPQLVFAYSKIECTSTERYNSGRFEKTFTVPIDETGSALQQTVAQGDSKIHFVTYYSKQQDLFGARIVDDNLGTTSGNFVEPSKEKALVKVRYIKSKPEMQLFALDCEMK